MAGDVHTMQQMNATPSEGDQQDNMLPSIERDTAPVLDDSTAPVNFYELTPCQFGISVQSFTPASSANRKDKSRLAQIKSRRRSNIGVRGSPETNSLIRYMAQQRMKTPPMSQTPELVKSSPFVPRVASSLRQKIASFQNLMDVKESDAFDATAALDTNTEGCIKTRDYLSDGNNCDVGKENNPPATPTPSKRRRLGLLESCNQEIREAPIQHLGLKKQKVSEEPVEPGMTEGHLSSNETMKPVEANCSAEGGASELQNQSHTGRLQATSHLLRFSPPHVASLQSLGEMESTEDNQKPKVKKKKQVCFGGPLSPELFDKNLPPSTPLQKGGTPARAPTPGGSLQLRSVLKTPQRIETKTPHSDLELTSHDAFNSSPTLAFPCSRKAYSQIVFPPLEEIDSAETTTTECPLDVQPLNLNTAFFKDSPSQTETAGDVSSDSVNEAISAVFSAAMPEQNTELDIKSPQISNRRKKEGPEEDLTSKAPTCSSSRKRKHPEQSEPVKRSTRSAARSASCKMKVTSMGVRRWSKNVDRSLYGSREYASKIPKLSPITEKSSVSSLSPAVLQSPCVVRTENPIQESSVGMLYSQSGDLALKGSVEAVTEDSVILTESSPNCADEEVGLMSGSKVLELTTEVSSMDSDLPRALPTSVHPGSAGTPSHHTDTEQGDLTSEGDCELTRESALSSSSAPPSCDTSSHSCNKSCSSEQIQSRTVRSRKSSEEASALQEHQEENGSGHTRCDQVECQLETIHSGFVALEEPSVAPWHTDFNFEDVFKPVPARGQRSVRRSLRNRSDAQHSSSAGLAWLPRTSPDNSKETRRKTRGRRLSAALPEHLSP